ncbi:hypothetical protein SDC9_200504 [bioreactor metagenome]|uniref:DUF2179 domain-containing protein n=1 Tax=bioreactor metagenome TaxID=1076179 RepID=A0A645INE9_9ZZZZ
MLIGLISYGIEAVLVGFIAVWSSSFAIDRILTFGAEKAKSIYIISDKIQEINTAIHQQLDRGTTILEGRGGYTDEHKDVLLLVIDNTQYPKLIKMVNEMDKNAFVIVQDANEVHGNGFSFDYKI